MDSCNTFLDDNESTLFVYEERFNDHQQRKLKETRLCHEEFSLSDLRLMSFITTMHSIICTMLCRHKVGCFKLSFWTCTKIVQRCFFCSSIRQMSDLSNTWTRSHDIILSVAIQVLQSTHLYNNQVFKPKCMERWQHNPLFFSLVKFLWVLFVFKSLIMSLPYLTSIG